MDQVQALRPLLFVEAIAKRQIRPLDLGPLPVHRTGVEMDCRAWSLGGLLFPKKGETPLPDTRRPGARGYSKPAGGGVIKVKRVASETGCHTLAWEKLRIPFEKHLDGFRSGSGIDRNGGKWHTERP